MMENLSYPPEPIAQSGFGTLLRADHESRLKLIPTYSRVSQYHQIGLRLRPGAVMEPSFSFSARPNNRSWPRANLDNLAMKEVGSLITDSELNSHRYGATYPSGFLVLPAPDG